MLRIKVEQNSICKNKMPPKKDTTKSSTTEASEDETSCREQLETLQLQLEEAWAVAREAQGRVLTAEEDHEWILERAREYEAIAKDQREKVMAETLAELRAPGEVYFTKMADFLMYYWRSPGRQRQPNGLQLWHRASHLTCGTRFICKVSPLQCLQ